MKSVKLRGITLSKGKLEGKLVYISTSKDLEKLDENSIAVLSDCGKSISLEAINLSKGAINSQMSITAHLSLNLSNKAYVIIPDISELEDGEFYRIEVIELETLDSEMLSYINRAESDNVEQYGGKGAKLDLISKIPKIYVPDYFTIPIQEIVSKLYSNKKLQHYLYNIADDEIITKELFSDFKTYVLSKLKLEFSKPNNIYFSDNVLFAVRSSGLNEDGDDDPMAGKYDSFLKITKNKLDYYIKKVVMSAFTDHEYVGQKGVLLKRINDYPKIAVVIQKMVNNPLFSGAFFSHASNKKPYPIVEAVYKGYADIFMDGKIGADLSIVSSIKDDNIEELRLFNGDKVLYNENIKLFVKLFEQAVKIYKATGYGDSEFVIDGNKNIYWVQARPLAVEVAKYPISEIVDRTGFAPIAVEYYKKLAPMVSQANLTEELNIQIFDIAEGYFGYDSNIRKRDVKFLEKIKNDISFLKDVTKYGYKIENEISILIKDVEDGKYVFENIKDKLFNLLVLHGAVQLPFSIPTSGSKDRHKSISVDKTVQLKYFDELADKWIAQSGLSDFNSGVDLITFLRTPVENSWQIMQNKMISSVKRKANITYLDCYSIALFEFRDVPYFNSSVYLNIDNPNNDINFHGQKYEDDLLNIVKLFRNNKIMYNDELTTVDRGKVVRNIKERLSDDLAISFEIISDYLLMKGETNETHSLYRGKFFLWYAENEYNTK